jgi:hypothetical protein
MSDILVTYHYPKEPHTDHEEILTLDEIKDLYPNYATAISDSGFKSLVVSYDNIEVAFIRASRPKPLS